MRGLIGIFKGNGLFTSVQNFLQHDLLQQANVSEQASSIQAAGGGFEIKENPTIRELLERAATELSESKIEQKFPGAPEVQCAILQTVGSTYHSIGEFGKAIYRKSGDV